MSQDPVSRSRRMRPCDRSVVSLVGSFVLAIGSPHTTQAQVPESNSGSSLAAPVNHVLDITAGATRSDNVRRTPDNEIDDTLATIGLLADIARDGSRLDYSLQSDVAWTEYLDDNYDGLPVGYLDGILGFDFVVDRFRWNFQETFNQAIVDAFLPLSPDNLQSVNYFTTGPQLDFALGTSNRLTLRGDYSIVNSSSDSPQATDSDSERYSGNLTVTHDISSSSSTYLSAGTQNIDFDSEAAADYESNVAMLGYRLLGARTRLHAAIGYNEIGGDSAASSGWVGRLELARRVSPASTFSAYASRDIGDTADAFRNEASRPSGGSGIELATTDVFTSDVFGAGWSFQQAHTGFTIGISWTEENHDTDETLDRTVRGANASFNRLLTPFLSLTLTAGYEREKYDVSSLENKMTEGSARLGWRMGRQSEVSLMYEIFDQDSSGGTANFTENRFGLKYAYHVAAQAQ